MNLRSAFTIMKAERDELGAVAKLKRESPQAFAQYVARLRRRREAITNEIDKLPESGDKLTVDVAHLKAKRNLLKTLITEMENIDDITLNASAKVADLQKQMKEETTKKDKHFNSVPPEHK